MKRDSLICTDDVGFYKLIRDLLPPDGESLHGEFINGMASMNGIESLWALLKRGHNGTHHHFSRKYTDRCVNEFAFRLSEDSVRYHTVDRSKSLLDSANETRLTNSELVA